MVSIRKKLLVNGLAAPAFNSSTQTYDKLDVTNFKTSGVSVQCAGVAGIAGTGKLQWSNDGTNWADVPAANATTIVVAGPGLYVINAINLGLCFIQLLVTSSNANPITVTGLMVGKEF